MGVAEFFNMGRVGSMVCPHEPFPYTDLITRRSPLIKGTDHSNVHDLPLR